MTWLESLPDDWWKSYQSISISSQAIQEFNIEILFFTRSLLLETRTYARVCKRVCILSNDFQNTLDARYINLIKSKKKCIQSIKSLASIIDEIDETSSNIERIELSMHWLAIDGQQPIISENPLPNFIENNTLNNQSEINNREKIIPTDLADRSPFIKKLFELARSTNITNNQIDDHVHLLTKNNLTIKPIHPRNISMRRSNQNNNLALSVQSFSGSLSHELSIEQQIYFKNVTESCFNGTNEECIDAFQCLASDAALQPLVPRLLLFISKGIEKNIYLNDLTYILQYLSILKILTTNTFISFEKYLHTIIPSLLTCLVCVFDTPKIRTIPTTTETINPNNLSTIWLLREQASDLLIFFQNHFSTISFLTQRIVSILKSKLINNDTIITYSIVYIILRTLLLIDRLEHSSMTLNIIRQKHEQIKRYESDFDLDATEQETLFDRKIVELLKEYNLLL